jgi:polyferredoxin
VAPYAFIADVVVLIHALYVGFVVIGFVLVVAGAIVGWQWVHSFWFRLAHLAAIAVVCAEALAGVTCPLTSLEDLLRRRAGQAVYGRDFVGYWLDRIVFYNFPRWVFVDAYLIFMTIVVITLAAVPPYWPFGRNSSARKIERPRHEASR